MTYTSLSRTGSLEAQARTSSCSRQTNTTERVFVASDGTEGNDGSGHPFFSPAISADGRFVTYSSLASNLVPGDTNGTQDILVVQTAASTFSVGAAGTICCSGRSLDNFII